MELTLIREKRVCMAVFGNVFQGIFRGKIGNFRTSHPRHMHVHGEDARPTQFAWCRTHDNSVSTGLEQGQDT